MNHQPSRRSFLAGTTALVIATTIELKGAGPALAQAKAPAAPMPNAFIKIAPDSTVTVMIKHLDKGQGVATGLTTIVADELDAAWSQMRATHAPANAALYGNLLFRGRQGTGGSTSVANSFDQLRRAAAAARAMLVSAAAAKWNVPESEITVASGTISHAASGKSSAFGAFAAAAAALPVPQDPKLKDPSQWVYIGKHVPRIDNVEKTTGKAIYSMDIRRPGQLTAMILYPPAFGAKVKSVDDSAALKIKGVEKVVTIPTGVAVVAADTWSAMKGREALKVTWDLSAAETRSTDQMIAEYKAMADKPSGTATKRGDAAAALKKAKATVNAEFIFPFLAHAPMEPLNATIAKNADGSFETWHGCQSQTNDQMMVAKICGVPPEKVTINTLWAGGSFGRRSSTNSDLIAEAAQILMALGGKNPVHLVRDRVDDTKGGYYRPLFYHTVKAGLDAKGNLQGWDHKIVGKGLIIGTPFEAMALKDGVDLTATEGAANHPYAVADMVLTASHPRDNIPVLWWRSVGHTHTGHVIETVIDELAVAAKKDPVAFRLAHIKDHPRLAAVLQMAADKAQWGSPLPKGRGRGVAAVESFGTFVGMVAEVTVTGREVKIDRIVAAVDCGIAVNPDVVRAQVEGAVGFALATLLREKITFANGQVEQGNFDNYQPTRINEMPVVEVHLVASSAPPTGIGEPGVPPLAPAIGNAIFAATGKRLRDLPFAFDQLAGA